jgi:hypothetical protein
MTSVMIDQAAERGLSFTSVPCFNYRTESPKRVSTRESTTGQTVPERRLESEPIGSMRDPGGHDLFVLNAYPLDATMVLHLVCNVTMLPAPTMTDLLVATEKFVVAMAGNPEQRLSTLSSICAIEPIEHGADWVRVDNCWADLRSVTDLLRACPGIESAAVTVHRDELVAYLAGDPPPAIDTIHRFVMDSLTAHPSVLAPRSYVVCRHAPAHPSDIAAWRAVEAIHRGRPGQP